MAEVATVGDNCIDRYRSLGRTTVGGNAVNVAVHLALLGLRAAYHGVVGPDADGKRVLAALRDNGVESGHVEISDGRTAYTDIDAGAAGERIIAFEEFGVSGRYRPSEAEIEGLRGLRHVHIGWLADADRLKQALAAAGTSMSQDLSVSLPADDRRSANLRIAFASAGPSIEDGERLVARLLGAGAATAVVTCGALGSLAANRTERARMGALPITVVDTLGAGDSFIAGFIAARLGGQGLERCLEAGRDAAALTCTHLGGFPQVPLPLQRVP